MPLLQDMQLPFSSFHMQEFDGMWEEDDDDDDEAWCGQKKRPSDGNPSLAKDPQNQPIRLFYLKKK